MFKYGPVLFAAVARLSKLQNYVAWPDIQGNPYMLNLTYCKMPF